MTARQSSHNPIEAMKTRTPALLATLAALAFMSPARAGENHTHDHDHGSKIEITIPENLTDLRIAIEAEHANLAAAIEKNDIPAAHDAEQRLQALLQAIPAKTAALEESARVRIDGQARNLARAYDGIHHASDNKAWDQAASALKKAEGSLKLLAAQISKIPARL
jgi:hypothetical protein